MSRHQIRLLLCSAASVALIVGALFVLEWFRIDLGSAQIAIDLRNARMCPSGEPCSTIELAKMTGFYPVIAGGAFWCALPLALLVLGQCTARVMIGSASALASRIGYALGCGAFLAAFAAGYLFAPEPDTMFDVMGVMVARTFAPPMLLTGSLFAIVALRYALADDVDEDEYRPIIVDKDAAQDPQPEAAPPGERTRAPSSPPLAARTKSASTPPVAARTKSASTPPVAARTKSASTPPVVARTASPQQPLLARTLSPIGERTKAPSSPPAIARTESPSPAGRARSAQGSEPPIDAATAADLPARARTSSSGPIDVAARLSGAPIAVAIKPPLPEPVPVPPDQIPVAPESGLVIRKRTPSAAPLSAEQAPIATDAGLLVRVKSPSSVPVPLPAPAPRIAASSGSMPALERPAANAASSGSMPAFERPAADVTAPAPRLNYAVATATLTRLGISAQREDGTHKQVAWDSVVGVIARRLPQEAPYDGVTFVDVVSSAGATLRFLPWTQIDGAPILGEGEERARSFVQLVAARCLDAKLDSWTRVFADGGGRAAQLPSAKTLAAHDEKLA